MREGVVRVPCALSPSEMWRVRADLSLDRYVAERERRTIRQIGSDVAENNEQAEPVLVRSTVVELPSDFVPRVFDRWVTSEQLATRVTTRWHEELHDAAHACVVDIFFPAFADRVEMGYRQWLEPLGAGACSICTRTHVSIRADEKTPQWVCAAIERLAEHSMHASLREYPQLVVAHSALAEGARPRRARVPTTEEGAAAPRASRFFCHCELLGFVRIVCGTRRPALEET